MRLNTAFQVACALGVFGSTASAFVSQGAFVTRRANLSRKVHGGWDNDDFMSALSGGPDAMEEANQAYRDQSRYKPGEQNQELPEEPPQKGTPPEKAQERKYVPPPDGEEEESQGGTRFKEMMRLAKDPGRASMPRGPPPQYEPYQEPPPQNNPAPPPQMDFSSLSVEDQARMFREFMANQQQQQQQPYYQQPQAPPPPRQMPGGVDAQGRKIGRNKDADSIANTSDVYFAQLKRDSSIRTSARYRGDEAKANAVFEDPSVKEVEEQLKKNPYLTAQQERNRSFIEGTSDDERLVVVPGQTKTDKAPTYSGVSFRKKFQEAKRTKRGEPEPAPAEVKEEEPVAAAAPMEVEPKKEDLKVEEPKVEEPVAAPVEVEPVAETETDAPGETSEETRRDIRTLMGLLIKHRGGPGFGAGRLKGAEAERMENSLQDVLDTLRDEVGLPPSEEPAVVEDAVVEEPVTAKAPVSPLVTKDSLAATIACVEGAVDVYQNSSPAEVEGNLVSLRAALMAAVNTCNKVIAENEVANKAAYEAKRAVAAQPESAAPPSMDFPDSYQVTQNDEPTVVEEAQVEETTGDPNSELLHKIYNQLRLASGSEKFGLKGSLTAEEASSLKDQLVDMRSLLMEELDSGVPELESSSNAKPKTASTGTASKYAQMLSKAKAARKSKGDK